MVERFDFGGEGEGPRSFFVMTLWAYGFTDGIKLLDGTLDGTILAMISNSKQRQKPIEYSCTKYFIR